MASDEPDLEWLDSPASVGPSSTEASATVSATSQRSFPEGCPAYTQISFSLDRVNHLLLIKPDRNWDKTPSITSPSQSSSRPETPFFPPVLDEGFELKVAKLQANCAARNIRICGGNVEDLRALIDSKSYWETEALHYTALLHEHLDQVTDVGAYWRQEAARQKEVLALRASLIEYRADDQPEDMGTTRPHDEDADCMPEKREAYYYTTISHKHLEQAVDAAPHWKEEATYQREALTRWVPSLKDSVDSLRYNIDQLDYWREESSYLTVISDEKMENKRREYEPMKSDD